MIAGRVFPNLGLHTGHVYATYSAVAGRLWDHIIAATLEAPYALAPSALTGIQSDAPPGLKTADIGVVAYTLNATTMDNSTLAVQPFDDAHTIGLLPGDEWSFQVNAGERRLQ